MKFLLDLDSRLSRLSTVLECRLSTVDSRGLSTLLALNAQEQRCIGMGNQRSTTSLCLLTTLSSLSCTMAVHTSATPRNVLYIVYDDLRPDLSPYDVSFMDNQTPNIQRLADTGTLFERAYVQIAVCSPSRNSFSTGRRPNSTKVWNFINHFRNADCPTQNEMKISGTTMPGGFRGENPVQPKWTQTNTGGHAQCCTLCVVGDGCAGWTYNRGNCTLFSAIESYAACPSGQPAESSATCVSGTKGEFPQWTPLPGALGTLRDQRAARRAHARPPSPARTHSLLPSLSSSFMYRYILRES